MTGKGGGWEMVGRKDHQQEETEGGWSFTHPDVDGTGSSSLLDSIISTPLKKNNAVMSG